jgi:Protein of unknown function (DUF3522)
MFILALAIICYAYEQTTTEYYMTKGVMSKQFSIYKKIELPDRPLMQVSIEVRLYTTPNTVEENPVPNPSAFISREANPEYNWDYYIDLSNQYGQLIINYMPKAKFLILRIDGGLSDIFTRSPGYSIPSWDYSVTVSWTYCASGYFVSNSTSVCDIPVIFQGDVVPGTFAGVVSVPEGTQRLVINGTGIAASPDNFMFEAAGEDNIEILWPQSGDWYIIGRNAFNYELESCTWDAAGEETCNGYKIKHLDLKLFEYTSEDTYTYEESILSFIVAEDDMKYMYMIETANNKFSLGYKSPYKTTEALYLRTGVYYVTIDPGTPIRIYKSIMGTGLCNGNEYSISDDLMYSCRCRTYYSGRYCEVESMDSSIYYLGLYTLILSNLSMIPAILVGLLTGFYGESLIFFSNMIASMAYHSCDYNYYCFGVAYSWLQVIDFVLSYLSLTIVFVYLIRIPSKECKVFLFSLLSIGFFVLGIGRGFNTFVTEILVIFI